MNRVLKYYKYVEIKQFSKVDIKQNSFVNQASHRDPRHLHGNRVVYLFVYINMSVFCLISNHIFVYINHYDTFYSNNTSCAYSLIEFKNEKLKLKIQTEDRFIHIMN